MMTKRRAPLLDGRLSAAMALAENCRMFADFGADHGRLSAVMLLQDENRCALTADISAPALQKSRDLIASLGLNSRVTFAVANGLDALDALQNEQHLRALIHKAMRKEVHDSTKPNIDFIYKILEDAYNSGIPYDVTDLRPSIQAFAIGSTHQSLNCLKIVGKMRFRSKEPSTSTTSDDAELVFFDVEVFPNLFLVVYKKQDGDCVRLFNPSPDEISQLCKMNLVGFNNRRYDNHILLARIKGYNEYQLFKLSQRIISGSDNALSNEAYNLSYTDVYDFASSQNKKSLKKWEIELGIYHLENEYPWDEPLDVSHWNEVAEYCENDVKATEVVFNLLHNDFVARLLLADMSGLTANDTTNQHTIKILTNGIKDPQSQYVYTKLGEMRGEDGELLFPGYEYDAHGINRSRFLPDAKIVSG